MLKIVLENAGTDVIFEEFAIIYLKYFSNVVSVPMSSLSATKINTFAKTNSINFNMRI